MKYRKTVKCPYCGRRFTDVNFIELHYRVNKICGKEHRKELSRESGKCERVLEGKYQ